MSESQFAYSGLTLDELRSLAASPQVGTMEAMPQSFRALADHVGEVADLLSHAQADLPNWWKGPAADQAAATLGRAAAEAREFHGSALAAASAVSRCAQVVAAQQNQMMGVPEVPEPGITAVVQRPATPFDALEAARQDATYQAAHEQAVQVVNGIAAQYVETRGQLARIDSFSSESFTPVTAVAPSTSPNAGASEGSAHPTESGSEEGPRLSHLRYASPTGGSDRSEITLLRDQTAVTGEITYYSPARPRPIEVSGPKFSPREAAVLGIFEHAEGASHLMGGPALREIRDTASSAEHTATNAFNSTDRNAPPVDTRSESNPLSEYGQVDEPSSVRPDFQSADRPQISNQGYRTQGELTEKTTKNTDRTTIIDRDTLSEREPTSNIERFHYFPSTAGELPIASLPSTSQPQPDGPENSNSAMIPPYAGVGSARRGREDRNPRPAYLKERKSAWLPDTIAAPADGVITPDWFERP